MALAIPSRLLRKRKPTPPLPESKEKCNFRGSTSTCPNTQYCVVVQTLLLIWRNRGGVLGRLGCDTPKPPKERTNDYKSVRQGKSCNF
eukprot:6469555-Amphidinium_carterae.1